MKEKLCIIKKRINHNMVGQDCFLPVYNSDLEFMNKCKLDKPVLCSSRRSRNANHHKLVFAIAKCIKANLPEGHFLENQTPYDIIKAIMLKHRIVDYKMNLDGTVRVEPKSINFESMDEEQFQPVSDMIFQEGANILNIEVYELERNYLDYL